MFSLLVLCVCDVILHTMIIVTKIALIFFGYFHRLAAVVAPCSIWNSVVVLFFVLSLVLSHNLLHFLDVCLYFLYL